MSNALISSGTHKIVHVQCVNGVKAKVEFTNDLVQSNDFIRDEVMRHFKEQGITLQRILIVEK